MNQKQCADIFAVFQQATPQPKTELIYRNAFELLIAVILSAQSTDRAVNKITPHLFAVAPSAQAMAALGVQTLATYIQSLGLYHSKARHIIASCEILLRRYHGQIPNTREGLESLPGVGRKTANVILNTIFCQETIAVDTHIFRIARRIGLAKGENVYAVEQELLQIIPKKYMLHAHHWLILHGRYICKARKPECWRCPIQTLCEFPQKIMMKTHSEAN